jgi:exodeoxyribonuclease VII large subunit
MANLDNLEGNNQNNARIFSVSDYIKIISQGLKKFRAKIEGEVSQVKSGPTGHIYFTLKDEKDESVIECVIWQGNYNLYGIKLEEGMRIIAAGCPNLHQKYGFKFIADIIELAGAGVLKKEYEQLRKKLEEEGLFALERKKALPELPKRIGLITSEGGAVIHDFLNNLGKYGYNIKFMDSRVEGQAAVKDLIFAVDYFRKKENVDALVIIRGGGSLESLQAFNNEMLVRKIAGCQFPVICGIGHDKDVPLASLVADKAVSTPTAAAGILNESWDKAVNAITLFERDIFYRYQEMLQEIEYYFEESSNRLSRHLNSIFQKFERLNSRFKSILADINYNIKNFKKNFNFSKEILLKNFQRWIEVNSNFFNSAEKQLEIFNPARQLKLGYSLIYRSGRIIRSIRQVKIGEEIDVRVFDGKIISKIRKIIKNYGKV